MGLTRHPDGITVMFCDDNGDLRPAETVGGAFVELRGAHRSAVVTDSNPLTSAELLEPGSDDWLTVVAVADSQERLDGLIADLGPGSGPNTSAFSRRVEVRTHVGAGGPRIAPGRITLAEGKVLDDAAKKLEVSVLKVMGAGAVVDNRHPLFDDFMKAKPFKTPVPLI